MNPIKSLIVLMIAAHLSVLTFCFAEDSKRVPQVVKLAPANGEKNVDPKKVTQLSVTFDQDMNTNSFSWCGGGETFPPTNGKPKWIDKRTCVLPVKLQEKKHYILSINAPAFKGFQSAEGVPVVPVPYTFSTIGAKEMESRTLLSPQLAPDASRDEKWKSDVLWLQKTLAKVHKNLFFQMSREEFNERIEILVKSIPEKSDRELAAELTKIINAIGDSHTRLYFRNTNYWPIGFFCFEEGIYVRAIPKKFSEFYGQKLTAINGKPIEEAVAMLEPFLVHENSSAKQNSLAATLSNAKTLFLAGVGDSEKQVSYTFGKKELKLTADELNKIDLKQWLPTEENRLLSQKNSNLNYWSIWLDEKTLYFKYNECYNREDISFAQFNEKMFEEIDEKSCEKIIIDLRDNGGGSSPVFHPFLKTIKKRPHLNHAKNLKVIIGRRTFSSAILNAMELKSQTKAEFLGEATGGKPNHFGEVKGLTLSNLQADLSYSTKFFMRSLKNEDALYPDVSVPLRAKDWFSGSDDFLDAAKKP